MNTQEILLREKLSEHYTSVFEESLIDEIVDIGYCDKLKSGDLLIDIDDEMTHIPLIISGAVKIIRQENEEEELVLYYLEKGDTCAISFVNCINRKKSIFKGVVEKDVEAVFIPVERIDDWLTKYKSWRYFIIDSYHERLLEMVESIDSHAFMSLDDRLQKYLATQVKITKDKTLVITHKEIANDINSSRIVISRLLKRLETAGKIEIRRNKIIVKKV
ncbi:MAG: Crp/Fnr family transcriptional regulator [Urechidicola sp.]|nr:Crp/Fnr family transcriptional regulator [Urechidicola sp.]